MLYRKAPRKRGFFYGVGRETLHPGAPAGYSAQSRPDIRLVREAPGRRWTHVRGE